MIRLSSIIETFEADYLAQFADSILPGQRQALEAMKACRTSASPLMEAQCPDCDHRLLVPHSCGHRTCPHCQHHESQQWLERQLRKQVPATYFLVTFTLPPALRPLVWDHQRILYGALMGCAWDTVRTFVRNDRTLEGTAGAVAVLHTHSRCLDYHPHVHLVVPAAAINTQKRQWRTKSGKGSRYLFSQKALAKVFRAKLLTAIAQEGLVSPAQVPETWVVDVTWVGSGAKALVYLGRYLYRGVIREQDILACHKGEVTFRYRHAKTRRFERRTLPGAEFLALIFQHVLPKGLRRARNYGFLHPNSRCSIALLQSLGKIDPNRALAWLKPRPKLCCPRCSAEMEIVRTRIPPRPLPIPIPLSGTVEAVAV